MNIQIILLTYLQAPFGDLDIEATVKSVSLKGDRQSEVIAEKAVKTRSEFRYGSFQRVIPLPVRIQNTEVKAKYKNGMSAFNFTQSRGRKK